MFDVVPDSVRSTWLADVWVVPIGVERPYVGDVELAAELEVSMDVDTLLCMVGFTGAPGIEVSVFLRGGDDILDCSTSRLRVCEEDIFSVEAKGFRAYFLSILGETAGRVVLKLSLW